MAKAGKKEKEDEGLKVICRNRRATHEYEILDRLECGLLLQGTEVKSLREGIASLEDSYAKVEGSEVWLIGSEIPEYGTASRNNHKPKRQRKLLMHRREIERFAGKAAQKGFTLIPLRIYFKGGLAKVEIGIARGKQAHDKRQAEKKREAQRQIKQAMARKER